MDGTPWSRSSGWGGLSEDGEDCLGGRKCLCEGSERKGAAVQTVARITQTVTCRALIPGLRYGLLCTRREKK